MARILDRKDDTRINEIEKGVKNKFKWGWLDRVVTVKLDGESLDCVLAECMRKIDVPGKVLCSFCQDRVSYGSRGVKALESHITSQKHCKIIKTRRTNYALPTAQNTSSYGIHPMFKNVKIVPEVAKPIVSVEERTKNFECMVLGVLAEHSMPFTMAPVLVELSKSLASDPKALQELSLSRTAASYKMNYGMAETFQSETLENLRRTKFSLNLDESTSNNFQKVLCILVSYYNHQVGQVVVEHLESISVTKADSQSLFNVIVNLFQKLNIPWGNLMSVLMDSCNVMRGSKSGLEKRLRDKASHLLDIDGDSCHHIHNATKRFCDPFNYWVEGLHGDLYNDFKWSPDLREALEEICFILEIKYTMPARFVSHRWLSCYDITIDNLKLMPAFTVFYYAFLPVSEKLSFQHQILRIYLNRDLSTDAKDRIREIQNVLSAKKMTEDGKNRKNRIVDKLFTNRKQTFLVINLYVAVLPMLKKYVLLYELREPRIHMLFEDQKQLLMDFLSCFVRQEAIVDKTARDLKVLELRPNMLGKKNMFVGTGNVQDIQQHVRKFDKDVDVFLEATAKAYFQCGLHLQNKLPLTSSLLRCLTSLDPVARGNSSFLIRLKKLPELVTNVLTEDEKAAFHLEAHRYQVDQSLPSPMDDSGSCLRIDHWWCSVTKTDKYPAICKIALAVLSCFHGPQVEGAFNTMGDVIDPKSARINVETYSAIQTVKFHLRAKEKSAIKYFERKDILHGPVKVKLNRNMKTAHKRHKECLDAKREVLEEKKRRLSLKAQVQLSKAKARTLRVAAERKARLVHRRRLEKLAANRKKLSN